MLVLIKSAESTNLFIVYINYAIDKLEGIRLTVNVFKTLLYLEVDGNASTHLAVTDSLYLQRLSY